MSCVSYKSVIASAAVVVTAASIVVQAAVLKNAASSATTTTTASYNNMLYIHGTSSEASSGDNWHQDNLASIPVPWTWNAKFFSVAYVCKYDNECASATLYEEMQEKCVCNAQLRSDEVEVEDVVSHSVINSIATLVIPMAEQCENLCHNVNMVKRFLTGPLDIVAANQGMIHARCMIQTCLDPESKGPLVAVGNIVSIAGQQAGISEIPDWNLPGNSVRKFGDKVADAFYLRKTIAGRSSRGLLGMWYNNSCSGDRDELTCWDNSENPTFLACLASFTTTGDKCNQSYGSGNTFSTQWEPTLMAKALTTSLMTDGKFLNIQMWNDPSTGTPASSFFGHSIDGGAHNWEWLSDDNPIKTLNEAGKLFYYLSFNFSQGISTTDTNSTTNHCKGMVGDDGSLIFDYTKSPACPDVNLSRLEVQNVILPFLSKKEMWISSSDESNVASSCVIPAIEFDESLLCNSTHAALKKNSSVCSALQKKFNDGAESCWPTLVKIASGES